MIVGWLDAWSMAHSSIDALTHCFVLVVVVLGDWQANLSKLQDPEVQAVVHLPVEGRINAITHVRPFTRAPIIK